MKSRLLIQFLLGVPLVCASLVLWPGAMRLSGASQSGEDSATPLACFNRLVEQLSELQNPRYRDYLYRELEVGQVIRLSSLALKKSRVPTVEEYAAEEHPTDAIPPVAAHVQRTDDRYKIVKKTSDFIIVTDQSGAAKLVPAKEVYLRAYPPQSKLKEVIEKMRLKPGDWVRVGDNSKAFPTPIALHTIAGNPYPNLPSAYIPSIGKVVSVEPSGDAVLHLGFIAPKDDGLPWTFEGDYLIAREHLRPLASGSLEHVYQVLDPLLSQKIELAVGEKIRWRDDFGKMQTGTIAEVDHGLVTLESNEHHPNPVPLSRVFKLAQPESMGTPHTAQFNADPFDPDWDLENHLTRDFLNGAARLSSLPGFSSLKAPEQLAILTQYVQGVVPYDEGASFSERNGLTHYSDNICAGAASCRHQASLTAVVLSEAGFRVKLMWYAHPDTEAGPGEAHRWCEVNAGDQTYVVDPTSPRDRVVRRWDEILEIAKYDKAQTSFSRLYYTQSKRQRYEESH